MGGGVSSQYQTSQAFTDLNVELQKPVDGADIKTPRGVSAQEEVVRLRKLLADVAERLINHLQSRTDVQNIDLMKKGSCKEVFRLSSNLKIAIIVQKHRASISPAFPWIIFERITARKT